MSESESELDELWSKAECYLRLLGLRSPVGVGGWHSLWFREYGTTWCICYSACIPEFAGDPVPTRIGPIPILQCSLNVKETAAENLDALVAMCQWKVMDEHRQHEEAVAQMKESLGCVNSTATGWVRKVTCFLGQHDWDAYSEGHPARRCRRCGKWHWPSQK